MSAARGGGSLSCDSEQEIPEGLPSTAQNQELLGNGEARVMRERCEPASPRDLALREGSSSCGPGQLETIFWDRSDLCKGFPGDPVFQSTLLLLDTKCLPCLHSLSSQKRAGGQITPE